MKIVFIGDVVGENGKRLLRAALPGIKKEFAADVCVVNGENSHESGRGLSRRDARDIFACGRDVITGGNHSLRKRSAQFYEESEFVLCPGNMLSVSAGAGVCCADMGRCQLWVINLMGTALMESHRSPFFRLDEMLKDIPGKNILVDFHAEATSEKQAFARYADGRVSAVVGTHTHVQTNDDMILPAGTAYITDAGCVCAENSVLGMEIPLAVEKQKYLKPVNFKVASGAGYVNGVFIETDNDGKAVKITKIHRKFN